MAYCSTTDLITAGVHQGDSFDSNSKPTSTQATSLVNDVFNELNALLEGLSVTQPIIQGTSPLAYARMKRLNICGAGYRSDRSTYNMGGAPSDSEMIKGFKEEYDKGIEELKKNPKGYLPDAIVNDTQPWSFVSENYDLDLTYESSKPLARMDDSWWNI